MLLCEPPPPLQEDTLRVSFPIANVRCRLSAIQGFRCVLIGLTLTVQRKTSQARAHLEPKERGEQEAEASAPGGQGGGPTETCALSARAAWTDMGFYDGPTRFTGPRKWRFLSLLSFLGECVSWEGHNRVSGETLELLPGYGQENKQLKREIQGGKWGILKRLAGWMSIGADSLQHIS